MDRDELIGSAFALGWFVVMGAIAFVMEYVV